MPLPRTAAGSPRAVAAFGAAELALLVPLLGLERRMRRTGGPGIIPFEVAGTRERAGRIVEQWGAEGASAARASLLLDFPFLVAYSGVHANWCAMARDVLAEHDHARWAGWGDAVVASQIVAGACDAVENASLLGVLAGDVDTLPRVARAFALAKFALLAVGWVYAAAGLASHLRRH